MLNNFVEKKIFELSLQFEKFVDKFMFICYDCFYKGMNFFFERNDL